MPPLEFNASQIRRQQLKALGIGDTPVDAGYDEGEGDEPPEDEEELRDRLDLHQLLGQHSSLANGNEHAPLTAEQVIEEIDEIYQNHDLIRSMTAAGGGGCELAGAGVDQ